MIAVLVARGRSLPERGERAVRLPRVGRGRARLVPVLVVCGLTVALISWVSVGWVEALTSTFTYAVVLLSLVVLTGFTGQLSLAQYTMAGMGAYIAGRLVATTDISYELAILVGVFGAIPLGLIVGLPALRTRGVNLAVVTLGMALAFERLILANADRTGGAGGTLVGELRLFGIDFGSLRYPERYAFLALACFAIVGVMVSNLRRGRSGRRLLAVRANERAAASLGINVYGAKLYAFSLASGIAALGGILIAFRNQRVLYTNFGVFDSIFATVQGVIGGIGFVSGAVLGAAGSAGAIIPELFGSVGDIEQWVRLISGIGVILVLIQAPDGLAWLNIEGYHRLSAKVRAKLGRGPKRRTVYELPPVEAQRVRPAVLEVRNLTVRFGGVVAVSNVSFAVHPGEVVGLIGPNGAGKTTIIDAITGFVRPTAGSILLDDVAIESWGPSRRARAGIGRSFQSLELFDDMTVYDNLRAGSEPRDAYAYVTDLVHPGDPPLGPAAVAAVKELDLEDDLDRLPTELAFGRRRLVAIARAIAAAPSVLLLDEPAAGLDDTETRELGHLITRLAKDWGIAVLLVEHDVGLVLSICDRVEALDFGRSIASGTPAEIAVDDAVITAYLGAQSVHVVGAAATDDPSAGRDVSDAPLLEAVGLYAGFGGVSVVHDLSLEVRPGEVVVLLGANGAGKSTTLRTLAGAIAPIAGEVRWQGAPTHAPLHRRARRGLSLVTEERSVFMGLTAEANLRLGRGPGREGARPVPRAAASGEAPRGPALRRRAADPHPCPRARRPSRERSSPTSSRSASRHSSSTACSLPSATRPTAAWACCSSNSTPRRRWRSPIAATCCAAAAWCFKAPPPSSRVTSTSCGTPT